MESGGQTRDCTSSDIENSQLINSIEEELERLTPLSPDCGIYKVRKRLRHGNERLYAPQIVSIGPLHHDHYINDYVVLMSELVMTPKDVDLMVKYGLIDKRSDISATHIQNLSREAIYYPTNFYFARLCEDLNTYCGASWHKRKATLKQNYFNTPWAIISFIAVVILLLLTLI
ncbi:hypothetical protein CJ030_MR5G024997 [Morella rubra]|uniref:Uncharacterized protein n=1 Tax=Morella rubra TaxID=262757 RepID=A0A6A1VH94_9ROSI|nr:hypothetical protein CJ030_MR5G024997 [Morella rubra]